MCYSGMCGWEDRTGNCRFPSNKFVRAVYKHPICEIPTCKEEEDYFNSIEFRNTKDDINALIEQSKVYELRLKKVKKIRERL